MPVLHIYFDAERNTRPDFRLNRQSINGLIQILLEMTQQDHGWGQHLEVLVFVYWLAHALSYRVTLRIFSIPKSTVCRVVHNISHQIKNVVAAGRVICYPLPGQIELAMDLHNWHGILRSERLLEQLMAATSGSRHQDAIKRIVLITNS